MWVKFCEPKVFRSRLCGDINDKRKTSAHNCKWKNFWMGHRVNIASTFLLPFSSRHALCPPFCNEVFQHQGAVIEGIKRFDVCRMWNDAESAFYWSNFKNFAFKFHSPRCLIAVGLKCGKGFDVRSFFLECSSSRNWFLLTLKKSG